MMQARGRRLSVGFVVGVITGLTLLIVACAQPDDSANRGRDSVAPDQGAISTTPATKANSTLAPITVYRSPTCGCCVGWEESLARAGFDVESVVTDDVAAIKNDLRVPHEMRSCHTAIIGKYFIEGHVPVEAIYKLLEEQPAIDGIALPGMPQGSPGMTGEKSEPFVIYSVSDGSVDEFMTI